MTIDLTVANLPPTVNHYWLAAGKRRYISIPGHAFRALIVAAVNGRKISGRLNCYVELTASNRRRWDLDNRIKALLDALQHAGLFDDDSQVDKLTVYRMTVGDTDRTRVVISRIEGA
jgi:crossover junction endodeoxyribonuclease RusA